MNDNSVSADRVWQAFSDAKHHLKNQGQNDEEFASRNYGNGDLERFSRRLKAIGFIGCERILDLGCGYGQWSIAASALNQKVIGVDIDPGRIQFCGAMAKNLSIGNVSFKQGGLDALASNDKFDAIFMFSVLPWLPWREALPQAIQHLDSGGLLYFNANDLGWLLHNIVKNPRVSEDFDSRAWALRSIALTDNYERTGQFLQTNPKDSLYIPLEDMLALLGTLPVEILGSGGDGTLSIDESIQPTPFFPEMVFGERAVYEVLCRKR